MYKSYTTNMALQFTFNVEKSEFLKVTRGVSFVEIIAAIEEGNLLDNIAHPSHKHPNQRMLVVKIGHYAYVVPYVFQGTQQRLLLKTLYPSRVMTRKYIQRKESHV